MLLQMQVIENPPIVPQGTFEEREA